MAQKGTTILSLGGTIRTNARGRTIFAWYATTYFSTQSYESMLPSRPSSTTGTNIFGDIWTSHKSLGSSYISSKGQTPRSHTLGFV
jgi:hypothetical protein